MNSRIICSIINQISARNFLLILIPVLLVACHGPVYKTRYKPAYQPYQDRPVSSNRQSVLSKAKSLIGKPYRYGGNHPATGFDCSGFVQYTHATAGIDLPRTTYQQLRATHPVSRQQLRPGDLVFFRINHKRFVSHVGIYLGNGKFIHSPSSGKSVSIAKLNNPYWRRVYSSAGRVF